MRKLGVMGKRPAEVPDTCPITGLPFFSMEYAIDDEHGNLVPTYGGPFDSYTVPVRDDDGHWYRDHYDHDVGGWVESEWCGDDEDLQQHGGDGR